MSRMSGKFSFDHFSSSRELFAILLFCLASVLSARAQTSSIDSLENILKTSTDTARVNLLNKLSDIYSRDSQKKGLPYAQEALELSQKLNFQIGIAKSYRALAVASFFNNDHPKSIDYLLLSASQAASISEWNLEAKAYLNLGAIYSGVLGNYPKAMEYYTKALNTFELHKIDGERYNAYAGIASVFTSQKEYDKALEYYLKSLELLEKTKDKSSLATICKNIGDLHMSKNEIDEAEKYYVKALENFERDGGIIVTKVKLSDIYRLRGEFDRALTNDLEAYAISEKSTYERARFYCVESLGKTYQAKKEYAKSKGYFEEAVAIAHRAKMLEKLMDNYKCLAEVAYAMKDFEKAYEYQTQHTLYVDSVRSKERTSQLAEMEVRFRTDQTEKENQLLKKDNDLNRLYMAIAVLSLASIMVIALLIINRQRIKMRSRELIAEKEKKLLEAELKNTQLSETQLRSEIEYKNKELTTYTLNLIQKNEILEELKTTLEQIRVTPSQELSGKLNGLISSVNFSFHLDREWEGFKRHFEEVHESFFEKLRTRFPDLNMNDMKLCALLKLNLETKEVATILGISPDSTKVARHRLRKKLGLSTDQNLASFLASF